MKKHFTAAVIVIATLVVNSNALSIKKRMVYYQQPASTQLYGAPQHLMYLHYVQPSSNNARSSQAVSALVAGKSVATGTYLEDSTHPQSDVTAAGSIVQNEDVSGAAGAHSSDLVSEAYPDDSSVLDAVPPSRDLTVQFKTQNADNIVADLFTQEKKNGHAPLQRDDEAKIPCDYNFDADEPDEPAPLAVASELPVPAPVPSISTPARRYLASNKKVYVELDHTSAKAADDEQPEIENAITVADNKKVEKDDEETEVTAVPKKPIYILTGRRPEAQKPSKPSRTAAACSGCAKATLSNSASKLQIPAGTFFPIDFGGAAGGAIAIANSFSTGEGGSATSHAIAYGSPDSARGRVRPSKLH